MGNFENNIPCQDENSFVQQPWQSPVKQKKESPFANSPYESPFTHPAGQSAAPVVRKAGKNKKGTGSRLISIVLVVVLVMSSCAVTAAVVNDRWEAEMALMSEATKNKLDVMQQQINEALENENPGNAPVLPANVMTPAQVYDACSDAVVLVSCTVQATVNGQTQNGFFTGTGFAITADGYIVTNYHVVEGAVKVTITTTGGKEYSARVIGYESSNDIALLKAEAAELPFVQMGKSSALQVGEQVAAIGNPLGELTSTLTVGYISAKDRVITTDGTAINMLQTDCAINSGNSGGPLFNMYGQVVGITTAKYSGESASGATIEGIGFAIPIDDVAGMLEDLQKYGYITGAYLGVMVRDVDSYGQSYGLPSGAYVVEVTQGYAAEKAGIKAGDIIVNIGGYDVDAMSDISRVLRKFKAGDTTTITVYRNGREVNLSITLDEKPQSNNHAPTVTPDDAPTTGDFNEWYEFFKKFFGID